MLMKGLRYKLCPEVTGETELLIAAKSMHKAGDPTPEQVEDYERKWVEVIRRVGKGDRDLIMAFGDYMLEGAPPANFVRFVRDRIHAAMEEEFGPAPQLGSLSELGVEMHGLPPEIADLMRGTGMIVMVEIVGGQVVQQSVFDVMGAEFHDEIEDGFLDEDATFDSLDGLPETFIRLDTGETLEGLQLLEFLGNDLSSAMRRFFMNVNRLRRTIGKGRETMDSKTELLEHVRATLLVMDTVGLNPSMLCDRGQRAVADGRQFVADYEAAMRQDVE